MLGTLSQFSCLFHNHGNRGLESLDNFPKGIDLLLDANGIWSGFLKQKHF